MGIAVAEGGDDEVGIREHVAAVGGGFDPQRHPEVRDNPPRERLHGREHRRVGIDQRQRAAGEHGIGGHVPDHRAAEEMAAGADDHDLGSGGGGRRGQDAGHGRSSGVFGAILCDWSQEIRGNILPIRGKIGSLRAMPLPDPPYRVRTAGCIDRQRWHSTPGTRGPDAMLTVVLAGRGLYRCGAGEIRVGPGMVGMVVAHPAGVLRADPSDPYLHWYCRFGGAFALALAADWVARAGAPFVRLAIGRARGRPSARDGPHPPRRAPAQPWARPRSALAAAIAALEEAPPRARACAHRGGAG